jgi:NAD dependent epimerase/dehydratase
MKILVTGSEGFIGSHLIEALVKKKYNVKALVLYNSFNSWGWLDSLSPEIKNKIKVKLGDIRDSENINQHIKDTDVVINLAALIAIPFSYLAPRSYVDTNVNGVLNILNSCLKNKIKQLIHISTSEVYGTPKKVPILETNQLNAQSPYAATKIAADQLAMSFNKAYDLPVSIIRPFNTFGPRQSSRAIIPSIITQSLTKKVIEVGSLHPRRDLLFVEDTVQGIISAIGNKKTIGEVINLGSGFDVSVKQIIQRIGTITKKKIKFKISKERIRPKKSEVDRLLASNEKAKKILKWAPKNSGSSGLNYGLEKTIKWFSQSKNIKLYKSSFYNI